MSCVIISDVHGCYFTFLHLLNQIAIQHPHCQLMFGGDLIDRGPNSRQVVEFAIENKIPTTMGNHEDLLLAYSAHAKRGYKSRCASYYDRDVWLYNGGEEAMASWLPDMTCWYWGLPKEVLDWMQSLPAYIIPDAPPDEKGRKLLCSHTGYGLEVDPNEKISWFGALWGRHPDDGPFPEDEYYRVFGHTRVRKAEVTEKWANIDTGAAYKGYATMTAFHWPSKQVLEQSYDETPCEARFKMVEGRVCQ